MLDPSVTLVQEKDGAMCHVDLNMHMHMKNTPILVKKITQRTQTQE
mgnify:CR=1 FL=1